MSLPDFSKYISDHVAPEVIRRGKAIFATRGVLMKKKDLKKKKIAFQVTNDTYPTTFRVIIENFNNLEKIGFSCPCDDEDNEICRHQVAALLQLDILMDDEFTEEENSNTSEIRMENIDPKTLRLLTSRKNYIEAEKMARNWPAKIIEAKNAHVKADLEYRKKEFKIDIKQTQTGRFETSCTCHDIEQALCKHRTALFLQLLNDYGEFYFETIKNWDKIKNKLLAQYGYSLSDNLKGKFEFSFNKGRPVLRLLDSSIKRVTELPNNHPKAKEEEKVFHPTPSTNKDAIVLPAGVRSRHLSGAGGLDSFLHEHKNRASGIYKKLGVIINPYDKDFPHLVLNLVKGDVAEDEEEFSGKIEIVDLSRYIDYYSFPKKDRDLISPIRKLQPFERNKYLNRNSSYAGLWEHIYLEEGSSSIPKETQKLLLDYNHSRLKKLFPLLQNSERVFLLPKGGSYRTKNLHSLTIMEDFIIPEFEIVKKGNQITVQCLVNLDGKKIPVDHNQSKSPLVFLDEDRLYLMNKVIDAMVIYPYLRRNPVIISKEDWHQRLTEDIMPLSNKYRVHFSPNLVEKSDAIKPRFIIEFKELNNLLLIKPLFKYNNVEVEWNNGEQITTIKDDKVLLVKRDKEIEKSFFNSIKKSHTRFERNFNQSYFHLQSKEALSKNWFLNFMDLLRRENVITRGLDKLKKFRFNQNKPETKLELSSNIDWFDAQVEVNFGNQIADIGEIKKALSRKQNYIPLSDGSLGILPEQWMEKYGLLFRMGQTSEKGLSVSKYNFSIIDELYDYIDDERLIKELEEKRERLLNIENLPTVPIPHNVKTEMRSYQENGFHWLTYLDEIKWGGILADDMGLGKTLQTLSFLLHFKNVNKHCLTLVVCPTSVIYNWENEVEKFTPDLTYQIHHGPKRNYNIKELKKFNLLITSYGTLRSDIHLFSKFEFDYVVLDESQFIKNPASKVTKAAKLLTAGNRICLSGTPMQNNTFDLYSQINFLNPGMLGSTDFFKSEFSQPIDKGQDEERKAHLRKLVYPFILRRTKEQVAKDLPEKSEMVLFCEMDKKQRKIYEDYRNMYRSRILGTIDDQGLGRSQLTILQGLMRLRQICDSPAILKDQDYKNHSIKMDELSRELQENVGNHKVLIFSQFLGMLGLIRENLEKLDIPFEYFDGSTKPTDREKAVYNFQNNKESRVFLISLKAGGVGLNLTAADYVYIVDPWWNPAVEQQAIDRTHRIGQTKNIFAYRMICKDTIEEKILQLQKKKKSLVKDVIADESGFMKSLTKDDVMYLFS